MVTPDYTKKAIKNYNNKFDRIQALIPKGYKELIKEKTGLSINQYINNLIEEDIQNYK